MKLGPDRNGAELASRAPCACRPEGSLSMEQRYALVGSSPCRCLRSLPKLVSFDVLVLYGFFKLYYSNVSKKHEIAHVTANIKAQVKAANLSREHNVRYSNELHTRDQAFRDDWCKVEPMFCCFLSHRISARSHLNKFANFQPPPILTSTPVTAAMHKRLELLIF